MIKIVNSGKDSKTKEKRTITEQTGPQWLHETTKCGSTHCLHKVQTRHQ